MNVLPKPCAVPRMADIHHKEAKLMGEVPILGYVSERLMVDDPHTEYDDSGLSLTDVIKSCGTSVQPRQSVKLFE